MITPRALLLMLVFCSVLVSSPVRACESCAATTVFALARHSEVIARAAVVRESADHCCLLLLENFVGHAPRGTRIELRVDDAALQHGTQVLVFACLEQQRWITSAGPRSCLPASEMNLGPALAWFAALSDAERARFQSGSLAQELAIQSARWRDDLHFEQSALDAPHLFRLSRESSPGPRNFLNAIRARAHLKN